MSEHERFNFKTLDALKQKVDSLGVEIPFADSIDILKTPVSFGEKQVPNRLACHPMEGCDGLENGAPSDLTLRRYRRFAKGGAGLIWFEACAMLRETRANPRQLWIHDEVLQDYKDMVDMTRNAAQESMNHDPYLVLQLTHSGRYSRPSKKPAPIIAHHSEILDPKHNLSSDYSLITDEELDSLQDTFVRSAKLAKEAGFDAVDLKSCHRYLMSELFASHTRENSRYGGSFENRTRLLIETVQKIKREVPGIEVTSRLNVYDAISYPYGWGVDQEDYRTPDLAEPIKLIERLQELGYHGINVTIANPYFNPHYGRPYDRPIVGGHPPAEHPLEGIERLLKMSKAIQQRFKNLTIVGTGYSWLRQFVPYVAAATIEEGWASIAGLGRGAFAYPDFAKDIIQKGEMSGLKACVSCSSCTQIMRDHGQAGCVPRDAKVYKKIYQDGRNRDPETIRNEAKQCLDCIEPTCQSKCPSGIDIPRFLKQVAQGEERDAYLTLRESNMLPEICGYVCPVEVQCQGHCIQDAIGGKPVPIAMIQRYISERAINEGWTALTIPSYVSGKRIAIIGAGPAGLACAANLLEAGHQVVMIDRSTKPGGKASCVIPQNRLSEKKALSEIDAIFKPINTDRIEWRWHTSLGSDYTINDILNEGFDAVALTIGLGHTSRLVEEDQTPDGVLDALKFLDHMHRNPKHKVTGIVAIIGGGNTAVDAAITAKERGSEDVYLIYRRSFEEMPAWPNERDELVHKGVNILILNQPLGYNTDENNHVTGIRVIRTQLGAPDESGRRTPVPIEGTEHGIPCSTVIEAIGETPQLNLHEILSGIDCTEKGLVQVDPGTWKTSNPSVYAAGDLVNGGTTVVQAIAEGRDMAKSINGSFIG